MFCVFGCFFCSRGLYIYGSRLDAGFGSAVLVMGSFKRNGGVLLLSGPVSQGSSGSPGSFLLAT